MANAGVSTWSIRFESCLAQKHLGGRSRQRGSKTLTAPCRRLKRRHACRWITPKAFA